MRTHAQWLWLSLIGLCTCTHGAPMSSTPSASQSGTVTISLVGTNDTHGRIGNLPTFAGYLSNLRAARSREGGAVVLLDGGDMFQGTLESNLNEGASVVQAFTALGYDAAALGNHEFDFGPVGPHAIVEDAQDDPRGALLARAGEAPYPILSINLVREGTQDVFPLGPRGGGSIVVERAGLRIGIIGGSTESTPHTTNARNLTGLRFLPLGESIAREADRLRAQGVNLVFVAMHAGGKCHDFSNPDDTSSCDANEEAEQVTRALRPGLVDAIVAGHTHAGVAHRFNGVPVIESLSNAQAFGRIDFTVDLQTKHVQNVRIYPPTRLCGVGRENACDQTAYEGAPVQIDVAMQSRLGWAFEQARVKKEERLGATLTATFARHYDRESALGNLLADLILASTPGADVALMNGGGIRTDLPAGQITYGQLFEVFPFDNDFARVSLTGAELSRVLAHNLGRDSGILSIAGVRAVAACENGQMRVRLTRTDGRPVRDDERLEIVTSDFIAGGGDGVFTHAAAEGNVRIESERPVIRELLAEQLRHQSAPLDPAQYAPEGHRRLQYEGTRPLRCSAQ